MKRRTLCGLGAAATVAVLTAAAPTTADRASTNPFTVGCYDSLDQQANATIVAYTPATQSLSPEEICEREWAAQGHHGHYDLVTCVVDGGGMAVLPNSVSSSQSAACGSIGAATPEEDASYGSLTAGGVRSLGWSLGRRYEATWPDGEMCNSSEVLERLAKDAIRRSPAGQAWSVRVAEAAGCAAFTIDAAGAEIVISAL